MTVDFPDAGQTLQLLSLWKKTFGEHNGFWELFLETGFSPRRCRCITEAGQVTAALCWLDCLCDGQKLAYIYAVVTHPDFRGRGLCRALLSDVHAQLTAEGYAAALLVPAEESLRVMYRKLDYRDCTTVSEFSCAAGESQASLKAIGPGEYALLRRKLLPKGGVVQEGENLTFLAQQAQFYAGNDFLLAAYVEEDTLHAMELLGNAAAVPNIVKALDCKKGHFRTPGTKTPFAMFHPLTEVAVIPEYFGFAFD